MEYTKVTVQVLPVSEIANDLLVAQMGEMGFESFSETEEGFEAYIPSKYFGNIDLDSIYCPLEGIELSFSSEIIADENWNKVWEENYFQPIEIAQQCLIRSSFHESKEGFQYEIIIDPRMSFGTGHHETTSLIVQHLLDTDVKGLSVLDMGCGTAILGILCCMKGAEKATGIDIDEWAYNNAIENLRLNAIDNMQIELGGAERLGEEKYDLILANINRNILLNDMAAYAQVLKPCGRIFFSGFYTEDLTTIDEEAQKHNLKLLSQKTQNNWTAVAYIKAK